MKNIFVINSKAGKGKKALKFKQLIENYCISTKTPFEIFVSQSIAVTKNELKTLLNETNEKIRVFACGGDGTLSCVINATRGFDNVVVGFIPLGSGNDFARNFSNKDNFLVLQKQLEGYEISLDLIKCENEYAVNQCSIGLDAQACARQVFFKKLPFVSGEFAFVLAAVYTLAKEKNTYYSVSIDSKKADTLNLLFCLAANTKYYGGGYKGAPDANATDGYIDLVAVENVGSKLKLLKLLPKYKKGLHKNWSITKITRCKSVTVKTVQKCAVNVDGECHFSNKATFEIVEKALNFSVPVGSKLIV